MEKTVLFRDFEERDIDFIYKCKNDEKLNSMIVGQFKSFSHEDAVKWVHSCMGEHETFKFWAVCKNDDSKNIVGWIALSDIDKINKSAFWYSLVVGDPQYRNGLPWIEIQQFILNYVFNILHLHRLEFGCLTDHPTSMAMGNVLGFKLEGIKRDANLKNNRYYDEAFFSLLSEEYSDKKNDGFYDFMSIVSRYAAFKRESNNK